MWVFDQNGVIRKIGWKLGCKKYKLPIILKLGIPHLGTNKMEPIYIFPII